jgi:DNA-directed RNA polymerase subunit beta'
MVDEVPLILNRAPTLMRTNIMALKPIPVAGKTIGLNILHLPGYAADYDGDAMSAFVPMSPEAIKEAKEKLLPEHHLHDARKGFGNPMFAPGHEAILGSVHLTKPDHEKAVVEFASEDEAMKALERGEIDDNTPIKIKG